MPVRLFYSAAVAVVVLSLQAPAWAQTPDIRPGLWEFTMSGAGTQGMKQSVCFTPAMVKDMKGLAAKGGAQSDCKTSNERASGKSRMFDVSCTKPQKYDARIKVTVESPESFAMEQEYTAEMGGQKQQGAMKMTYRRLGECK
jgi:Protein of unknown function (DUF3617)